MNKRILNIFVMIFLTAVIGIVGVSCDKMDTESPDPTAIPITTPPPGRFNEGKVKYTLETKTTLIPTFDISLLGKPIDENTKGVEVIIGSDFEDGDPFMDGGAAAREQSHAAVEDGILYFPYEEGLNPPLTRNSWTTWAPTEEANVSDYHQVQLSAKLQAYSFQPGQWNSVFIGMYKSNHSSIADHGGDGYFFAFNPTGNKIVFYGGDNHKWPEGNASIALPKGLLDKVVEIDIICTENYDTYVYIDDTLYASATYKDGRISLFDGENKEVFSDTCGEEILAGGYFSFFTHGGGCAMDEIKVYGCSKGESKTEKIVTAVPEEGYSLGCDITNRDDVISICYSMWFNVINGNGTGEIKDVANVTELTEKYGWSDKYGFGNESQQYNQLHRFHYWGEPQQGYYRSTDTDAIRNNMTLLYNAGVDFIILDYTYATAQHYSPGSTPWKDYIYSPCVALLDTIMLMRSEGLGTPYVVFWMGDESLFDDVHTYFYGVEKWKDCFVYWNDKPFILKWTAEITDQTSTDMYTVRGMYGLRGTAGPDQWSYLEIDNKKTVAYDAEGNPEHMCACVATQETYMSKPTAHGRDGGRFWNSQWQEVFKVKPKIVTVTWWNEWCAQLYHVDGAGYVFTDNFNFEYSRDIEPVKGGHGDTYYRWLCQYITDYRAGNKCPELVED